MCVLSTPCGNVDKHSPFDIYIYIFEAEKYINPIDIFIFEVEKYINPVNLFSQIMCHHICIAFYRLDWRPSCNLCEQTNDVLGLS